MKLLIALSLFLFASTPALAESPTDIFSKGMDYGVSIARESVVYKPGEAERYCRAYACMNGYCEDRGSAVLFKDGCMKAYKEYWGE